MRKQMAASLAAHERSRPGGRCQCLLGNASLRPPLPLSLRRLPSIAQAALRAALAIASRFFVLTATNNNTLSLKTNTTRQQKQPHRKHPAASASAFTATTLTHSRLGLLNFQWNAPVSTQLHLLHEEGARRTSLDQFRPLLNTNQISPVYDKLGLNLV